MTDFPQTALTLKTAQEGDKTIWVYESFELVTTKINICTDRLVTFDRALGHLHVPFATRPDNIANISDITQ